MAEPYWRYPDGRMAAAYQPTPSGAPLKRQRSDYPDASGGHEFSGYAPREDDRNTRFVIRDTDSIGASYDHYLRNGQVPGYGAGESARPVPGVLANRPVDGPRVQGMPNMDGRGALYGVGRSEPPLPPDASNTLFVEGLPANCSRREVSHIFRPFVGFREVRLVNKESRHPGGEPLVLCFVDFANPNQAAVALEALQGYKFDEHDRESANLRLQFARFPGPRSAGGPRGRR